MVKTAEIRRKIVSSKSDRTFHAICIVITFVLTLCVLYPLIYILSCSFSSGTAVSTGRVTLWPVDFSIEGYRRVFVNERVWTGYRNTIAYTCVGTLYNVTMTLLCAYPLARRKLPGKGFFTFM